MPGGAPPRFGDVDHGKRASGADHSSELFERSGQVIEISQDKPADCRTECRIRKREAECARLHEAHAVPELAPRSLQHRVAQVDPNNVRLIRKEIAKLPGSAAEIEDSVPSFYVNRFRRATTPPAIEPEGQNAVEGVVLLDDVVEHRLDFVLGGRAHKSKPNFSRWRFDAT